MLDEVAVARHVGGWHERRVAQEQLDEDSVDCRCWFVITAQEFVTNARGETRGDERAEHTGEVFVADEEFVSELSLDDEVDGCGWMLSFSESAQYRRAEMKRNISEDFVWRSGKWHSERVALGDTDVVAVEEVATEFTHESGVMFDCDDTRTAM